MRILENKYIKSSAVWSLFIAFAIGLGLALSGTHCVTYDKITTGINKTKVVSLIGNPEWQGKMDGEEGGCYRLELSNWATENLGIKSYTGKVGLVITFLDDKVNKIERNKQEFLRTQ